MGEEPRQRCHQAARSPPSGPPQPCSVRRCLWLGQPPSVPAGFPQDLSTCLQGSLVPGSGWGSRWPHAGRRARTPSALGLPPGGWGFAPWDWVWLQEAAQPEERLPHLSLGTLKPPWTPTAASRRPVSPPWANERRWSSAGSGPGAPWWGSGPVDGPRGLGTVGKQGGGRADTPAAAPRTRGRRARSR